MTVKKKRAQKKSDRSTGSARSGKEPKEKKTTASVKSGKPVGIKARGRAAKAGSKKKAAAKKKSATKKTGEKKAGRSLNSKKSTSSTGFDNARKRRSRLAVRGILSAEATAWAQQSTTAKAAFDFVLAFLGCGMGPDGKTPLSANAKQNLLKGFRAVSWVESRHGTGSGQQPARDPLQAGNPKDAWWKALTGQSGPGDRFVRGEGLSNLWANQVAAEAEATAGFLSMASFTKLADKKKGHENIGYTPTHSYVWGCIYLIQRINTLPGDDTFNCRDASKKRIIDGAVEYNAGGHPGGRPGYRKELEEAWNLIGP